MTLLLAAIPIWNGPGPGCCAFAFAATDGLLIRLLDLEGELDGLGHLLLDHWALSLRPCSGDG
jgi:hypothetical protein